MIPKHIRMKNVARSNVLNLMDYLADAQGKTQRVAFAFVANCQAEDARMAAREMYCTQRKNFRARGDRTYHLMLSFRAGEEPDRETMRRIEREVCEKLGFGQHQRATVVHRDTDNLHMHVVVNKIHPKKLTIHDPFRDHSALATICAAAERKYRLEIDNHEPTGETAAGNKARDIEAMTGEESFIGFVRRECLAAMKTAASWESLHLDLARAGLALVLRGNGLVVADASGARAKSSAIDRSLSRSGLEKRLGAFRPASGDLAGMVPEKRYRREPVGVDDPLKEEFGKQREIARAERQARLDAIDAGRRRGLAAVRAGYERERLAAKRIPAGRSAKRALYTALNEKRRAESRRLRREAGQARKAVYRDARNRNWLSWLQEQAKAGRPEALAALRARAYVQVRKSGLRLHGDGPDAPPAILPGQPVDTVTKRGAVVYRVGSEAIRDDGAAFKVSREASQDTLILALRLAKQRYGEVLQLSHPPGDRDFAERILKAAVAGKPGIRFADPALEARRKSMLRIPTPTHEPQPGGMER
ncbi:MAG: relaxase/mobilization nuclease domain-containing protein [Planctomycetota bacterium]|jgi:hypothetical protein|nr:relaxase/mobilization nuclease domain-containing protein [Planctomycetota bacterium]